MLLWVLLISGLAAVFAIVALILLVGRAERRARRSLYRALGLAETTIEYLMERNRDVLAELSYLRGQGEAGVSEAIKAIEAAPSRHRNVVFLRPGRRSDRARGAEDHAPHADEPSSSTGRTRR